MWLVILPKIQKKHKRSKNYRPKCFLSSYEHLKFDLDRVQINMALLGKWLILVCFCQKLSEIVYSFLQKLYIIDILGRSIKIMYEKYRFMIVSKQYQVKSNKLNTSGPNRPPQCFH